MLLPRTCARARHWCRFKSDFRQEAGRDTTLKKLYEYIRDCSAVVCVIGRRCGDVPPPAAAAPFAHILPPGTAKASYAQWEFFFARHHRRRLSIYMANHDYRPDTLAHTRERNLDLQQDFLKHIDEQGLDRNYFSNVDQLCRSVLKEDWPKKRALLASNVPIGVPIHFLGREDALTEIESALNGAERCVVMALHGCAASARQQWWLKDSPETYKRGGQWWLKLPDAALDVANLSPIRLLNRVLVARFHIDLTVRVPMRLISARLVRPMHIDLTVGVPMRLISARLVRPMHIDLTVRVPMRLISVGPRLVRVCATCRERQ
jgi:hypothetical protein